MFNKKQSRNNMSRGSNNRNNFINVRSNKMPVNELLYDKNMFPELESSVPKTEVTVDKSQWSTNLKKLKEEEKEEKEENKKIAEININNSKYWCDSKWVGPIIMRGNLSSSSSSSRVEYSRDNIHWYSSADDVYSENELEQQRIDEEAENDERITKILDAYSRKHELASIQHYEEYGELDYYFQAIIRRHEYEEYAKQFEISPEAEKELDECGEEEDYLEEDDY
jgi:hypothetical protein